MYFNKKKGRPESINSALRLEGRLDIRSGDRTGPVEFRHDTQTDIRFMD
jgi:hypothetical protein